MKLKQTKVFGCGAQKIIYIYKKTAERKSSFSCIQLIFSYFLHFFLVLSKQEIYAAIFIYLFNFFYCTFLSQASELVHTF